MENTNQDDELFQFVENMPKVELHAHLNGCIRETTLFELAKERRVELCSKLFAATPPQAIDHSMYNIRPRSLQDCFDMFAQIPKCVNDLISLNRITLEAIEDFAARNVVYLELRSTPKVLLIDSAAGRNEMANKKLYCETIIKCMEEFEKRDVEEKDRADKHCRIPMVCRFIVAVDRSGSQEEALEHVELAIALKQEHPEYLVGVDLGGNPTKVCC